jgi:hypothetical protein
VLGPQRQRSSDAAGGRAVRVDRGGHGAHVRGARRWWSCVLGRERKRAGTAADLESCKPADDHQFSAAECRLRVRRYQWLSSTERGLSHRRRQNTVRHVYRCNRTTARNAGRYSRRVHTHYRSERRKRFSRPSCLQLHRAARTRYQRAVDPAHLQRLGRIPRVVHHQRRTGRWSIRKRRSPR